MLDFVGEVNMGFSVLEITTHANVFFLAESLPIPND
jgi:hypothetical protein